MDASDLALELIMQWEGYRSASYQDVAGIWTVGYGATGPTIGPHTVWEKDRAVADLKARLARIQHVLEALTQDRPMSSSQMAALCSLAYNIGVSAVEHSTLLEKWNAGDVQGAADQFLAWDKAHVDGKLTVVDGLEHRRVAERALFLQETP